MNLATDLRHEVPRREGHPDGAVSRLRMPVPDVLFRIAMADTVPAVGSGR